MSKEVQQVSSTKIVNDASTTTSAVVVGEIKSRTTPNSKSISGITTTTSNSNNNNNSNKEEDSQGKRRYSNSCSCNSIMSFIHKVQRIVIHQWKGNMDFVKAQFQVFIVLCIAYIGNNWKYSYPRNENKNYILFYCMNIAILVIGYYTIQHTPSNNNRIQILSRSQTEEWKGWMQWAFIMYHYYRATNVYNIIRVFVSSYVWMTGFGNFLYFDKKQDFSIERAVSMWLRINYFPILLSVFVGVPFDLLYIVPLHTTAFFITMITCYVAKVIETYSNSGSNSNSTSLQHWQCNVIAISLCFIVHVLFYETPAVYILETIFGHEIYFRFSSDKYSAVLGILSGYLWHHAQTFVTWCNTPIIQSSSSSSGTVTTTGATTGIETAETPTPSTSGMTSSSSPILSPEQVMAIYGQRIVGVIMIALWWILFGHITDKFTYNPIHPFVFWLPVFGWLMIRNSSKYLTELHSTALEFFGKITLETYVLQFHVFMCRNVQHIPIVIPGSGPNGSEILKFLNMLLTGIVFVALAYWARKITVTTQTTVTDLVVLLLDHNNNNNNNNTRNPSRNSNNNNGGIEATTISNMEKVPLTAITMDEESNLGGGITSTHNNDGHLK